MTRICQTTPGTSKNIYRKIKYIDKGDNIQNIWSTYNSSRFVNIWIKWSIYPSFYCLDVKLSEHVKPLHQNSIIIEKFTTECMFGVGRTKWHDLFTIQKYTRIRHLLIIFTNAIIRIIQNHLKNNVYSPLSMYIKKF